MSAGRGGALLAFEIGEARAALPLEIVREVVECPPIAAIPGSRTYVVGVVLNDGIAVPVYDLRRFEPLWEPETPSPPQDDPATLQHLIVVGYGETVIALVGSGTDLIDRVAVDAGTAEEATAIRPEFIRRQVRHDSSRIVLLDPDRLFLSLGVPADGVHGARGGRV